MLGPNDKGEECAESPKCGHGAVGQYLGKKKRHTDVQWFCGLAALFYYVCARSSISMAGRHLAS